VADAPIVPLLTHAIDYRGSFRDRLVIGVANAVLRAATKDARLLMRDMYLRGYAAALSAALPKEGT
jgi:hypothetical protein